MGKKCVPSVLTRPRAPPAKAVKAVFEGEEDEEMKEEDASSERRRRELLPLGIHRRKVSSVRVRGLFCVRILILFFPRRTLVSFLFISTKRLNFFFPRLKYYYYTTREKEPLLSATTHSKNNNNNNNNNNTRRPRKNPRPKRAVNARTVLKARTGVRVFEDS